MSVEDGLYSRLTSFSGLTALIGSRVRPHPAPQNEPYPFVTYQRIATTSEQPLGARASGLAHPVFQVSAFALTASECIDISEQVRLALQGYRGTVAGVEVQFIRHRNAVGPMYDDDARVWFMPSDFEVWHTESVPS